MDARRAVCGSRYRVDRLIQTRRGEHPIAPEPVEVHAGLVAHHAKEIGWRGMLERPRFDVLAERRVEAILAEHFIAEHLHHERRLLIATPEEIAYFDRPGDQRLFVSGQRMFGIEMERMRLDR